MTAAAHDLLAQVGISVSGYDAAELDDLLADGVNHSTKPAEQPDAPSLEADHQRHIAAGHHAQAHANRFRLDMAGPRWRKRRRALPV